MSFFLHSYGVDLAKLTVQKRMESLLLTQDARSDRIQVEVFNGGAVYDLSGGTGTAYIMRGDGNTVVVADLPISGNVMYCDLPAEAYNVPGVVTITLKHTESGEINSLIQVTATVRKSSSGNAIDPGGEVVLRFEEAIAELEEVEASIPPDYSTLAAGVVRHDTAQTLTPAQKTQARENINAQERIEPDGAVTLDLSDLAAVYIATGDVGQKITYKNSTASMTYKRIAWVQAGCAYALSITSGTLSSTNNRTCAITDTSDIILQRFDFVLVEDGTTEVTFTAEADGLLCVCVDTSTTTVALHGGLLYDTVRYTQQSLTTAQAAQVMENIGAASGGLVETIHALVDYGYGTGEKLTPQTNPHTYSVEQDGMELHLNSESAPSGTSFMRLSETLLRVSGTSQVRAWTGGVTLTPGHVYRINGRLVGGTVTITDQAPYISIYENGSSSTLSFLRSATGNYTHVWRIFTAGSTPVNVSLNTPTGVTYTNAVYQVYLEDITDCPECKNLAPSDTPTATDTHHPGDLLTVGGTLYRVTQAIAAGATITPGTNITETTVAEQLAALEARIAALEG